MYFLACARMATITRRSIITACCTGCFATPALTMASVALSANTVLAQEGIPFNGTVATFTTNDPSPLLSNYSSTMDWGDGTTSAGTVSTNGGSVFLVTGAHTYADERSYLTLITVADFADSSHASAAGTAIVLDAPLGAMGLYFQSTPNILFSGIVARFSDINPAGLLSDYSATINWGDGIQTAATISSNVASGFDVSGSHTYTATGLKTVTIHINDIGGSTAGATSYTGDRIFANGFDGN